MLSVRDLLQPLIAFGMTASAGWWFADSRSTPPVVKPSPPPAPVVEEKVPSPPLSDVRSSWLEALAAASPGQTSAFYEAAKDDRSRQDLVAHYWANSDPEGMLRYLLKDDGLAFRDDGHAAHLFRQWAAQDFAGALEAGHGLPAFNLHRHGLLRAVLAKGMETDPEGTFLSVKSVMGESGGGVWPEPDDKAVKLLATLPLIGTYELALNDGVEAWARRDPEAALDWVYAFGERKRFGDRKTLSMALHALAWSDAPMAFAEVQKLPAKARAAWIKWNAETLAEHDVAATVKLIEESVQGWSKVDVAAEATDDVSGRDPLKGMEFASAFGDPDVRQRALDEAVATFRKQDAEGFDQWFAQVRDPSLREEVAISLAEIEVLEAEGKSK